MSYLLDQVRSRAIMVKVNDTEYARIKSNAGRFTKGNMSQWLRASGIRYEPQDNEDVSKFNSEEEVNKPNEADQQFL